ncbi:hypothetical protein V8G54_029283 [Vigna mungo]|uniref:Uncharacterized protein n=1 Tax=Vigna mungo TaxID=3915 RepID=A0AAQ3MTY6_VIGMU
MAITLIRCFVLMVVSNIVIGNKMVIGSSAEKDVVRNIRSKWVHVLPVPPSGPSAEKDVVSKGFHVLPKGPVPPSGPSHPCTHPPCGHKNVVSNIKSKGFHVLPKGPVPPSGPSPPCGHPPFCGRGHGIPCC